MNNDDIVVYDDLIPKNLQRRILDSVTDRNLHWLDFNEEVSAGDYWKARNYSCEGLEIKESPCLVKLAYTGGARSPDDPEVIHQPECFYYMGLFILDLFAEKAGLNVKKILRMKINKQIPLHGFSENNCNGIHTDTEIQHKTLIYYINDSDGDTIIMNERFEPKHNIPGSDIHTTVAARVTPQQGRIVCFDGLRYHAPSNPMNFKTRYLLNINFVVE
jgi:hypothetical protein